MAKDYRRGPPVPPLPKRNRNRPCVWWLIAGTAIGAAGSSVLSPRGNTPEAAKDVAAQPARVEQPPPKFQFDKILSDSEVDVSKGPAPPPPAPRPQPPAAKPTPAEAEQATAEPMPPPPVEPVAEPRSGTYLVQAGSFNRAADAERLKAQLALLGVSASIQTATLPNGKTTHRVRTGAYASKQDAEKVRALLKRHGKDGLTIPVK